jgi:thymidylate synthase
MFISQNTLDDLLNVVFSKLLKSKTYIKPTRGRARELTGVLLEVKDPRARLSRTEKKGKLFSCLGEIVWYLAKSNNLKFIEYYIPRYAEDSEDRRTIYGGYGPRLFDMHGQDQIANVIQLLKSNPHSRRAVIQLFDAADIAKNRKEIPCTCTLQFFIRRKRLYMLTNMRSNDAFWGLSHDVFAFTMLQEILAVSIGVELGTYKHAVGSLHLYDEHLEGAKQFLAEGWQEFSQMPPMPKGDPWKSINKIVGAERKIRRGSQVDLSSLKLDKYWEDILRVLQIHTYWKANNRKQITILRKQMEHRCYDIYIKQKEKAAIKEEPLQLLLPYTPMEKNLARIHKVVGALS